jgi:hypothetical protein
LLAKAPSSIEDIREDVAKTPDSTEVLETKGLGPFAPSATTLAEAAENVIDINTLPEAAAPVSGLGEVAKIVVLLPLLGVAQDLMGFIDFLESIGGLFVVGIRIGVILLGELTIGLLDLVGSGLFADSENLIVVFLSHINLAEQEYKNSRGQSQMRFDRG